MGFADSDMVTATWFRLQSRSVSRAASARAGPPEPDFTPAVAVRWWVADIQCPGKVIEQFMIVRRGPVRPSGVIAKTRGSPGLPGREACARNDRRR